MTASIATTLEAAYTIKEMLKYCATQVKNEEADKIVVQPRRRHSMIRMLKNGYGGFIFNVSTIALRSDMLLKMIRERH
jgi:hypothetical protein